jgi:hypothetical protein
MERSVAKRSGLQELLDLAEPVFGNFITVQDSTFKLIAYTKNITPPGVVMHRLVQHGFHPPETIELFRKHRRLEEFKTSTDVIVSRDMITSDFDVVKKTFHVGGMIYILVVMECSGKAANTATTELFSILIEYIRSYIDLDISQTGGIAGAKALIHDIMSETAGSKEEARIRSTYCGYPFEGSFRLFVFSFDDENNVPTAHLVHQLTERCRDSVAFSWERHILLVAFEKADISETCASTESILTNTGFNCGVSNTFDCLWDISTSYKQALMALDISSRLKNSASGRKPGSFHLFSDYLVHHIVSTGINALPYVFENSFLGRCIAKLREYDEQHHTDAMKILRLFLENERSATQVASLMHMHRNTVLYHMEKISDMLGLSLDDSDTRLQLLLAFKADDLVQGRGNQ